MRELIITEEQGKKIAEKMSAEKAQPVKVYVIDPDKVLIVQKYLDSGFKRGKCEVVGPDGFPKITPIFAMLSSTGEVLQNLEREIMLDLLIEKYKKMFSDEDERKKFLTRVMDDWYNKKIGLFGRLSVNHL